MTIARTPLPCSHQPDRQAGAPIVLMVHVPRQHEGKAGVPLLLHAHSCLKLGACLLQQGRGARSGRDLGSLAGRVPGQHFSGQPPSTAGQNSWLRGEHMQAAPSDAPAACASREGLPSLATNHRSGTEKQLPPSVQALCQYAGSLGTSAGSASLARAGVYHPAAFGGLQHTAV